MKRRPRVRVQGMRKEELDMEVRLAATQALTNALEFASTNFSNETERNYLMQARTALKSHRHLVSHFPFNTQISWQPPVLSVCMGSAILG